MLGDNLKTWLKERFNVIPNIILKHNTQAAFFSFTDLQVNMISDLEPLEWLILTSLDQFDKITRLEISLLSNITLSDAEDELEKLLNQGLVQLVDYDKSTAEHNVEMIKTDLEEVWVDNTLSQLLERPSLLQYQLTSEGKKSLKQKKKQVNQVKNLDFIITEDPFKLYLEEYHLKHQSFDEINVDTDLANRVLHLAKEEGKTLKEKIIPIGVTGNTVVSGKEVASVDYWIMMELKSPLTKRLSDVRDYSLFLTSVSFLRWSKPEINISLDKLLDTDKSLIELIVKAFSDKFQMVEEVIQEGLLYDESQHIWILTVDLEMIKLIYEIESAPIHNLQSEIEVPCLTNWVLLLPVVLKPMDKLDEDALISARLHARLDKKGFTEDIAYNQYKVISDELKIKSNKKHFQKILKILLEYKSIKREELNIKQIVIDLDFVLQFRQRERSQWKFSRIRQLIELLDKAKITKRYYYASKRLLNKIDEEETLDNWMKKVDIQLIDEEKDVLEEAYLFALQKNFHIIGRQILENETDDDDDDYTIINSENHFDKDKTKQFRVKEMFIVPQVIKHSFDIPMLKSRYNWYPINIIDALYKKYYEE